MEATKKDSRLSPQAKLATIGYLLVTISMIIVATLLVKDRSVLMQFVSRIIAYVVLAIISIYAINCTVVGSCNLYAWVLGYLSVTIGTVAVISLILGLAS